MQFRSSKETDLKPGNAQQMTDPNLSLLASSEHQQLSRGFHPSTLEEQGKQPLKKTLNCKGEKRCPEVP